LLYPTNFELKIEFHKIRELIKEKCLSALGLKKAEEMSFMHSYETILISLLQTNEMKTICNMENSFPVTNYFDVSHFISKIKIEGYYLEAEELFDLQRSLDTIKSILNFFKNKSEEEYPQLLKLSQPIKVHSYISDRLDGILNKYGQIKDNASKELAEVRRTLHQKQSTVSSKLTKILKQVQHEGWVSSDLSLTIVNGRTVIPIDSTYKRKIKGLVHDVSATGKTAYIEPEEIVEINNEIKELEFAERREIIKILLKFTDDLRPYLDDIAASMEFLGEIDFIRAKALYAIRIDAILPAISKDPVVSLVNARHPLLQALLKKEKKDIVPLSLHLDDASRILLISGPNAGGKSVCLKTTGLLQYMMQCGLLVPTGGSSDMGIFENIFIDIGDEQSIENDLSTYSSHLTNMKFFMKNCNEKTMILIDEFGTGTEPMLGGAIAEAVLENICKTKTFGVLTTHYTNLKHFAAFTEGVINGAMLFDNQRMQPMFQLESGKPGSSFAFEIARKIGLPEEVILNAESKVGKEHIFFDKHLRSVLRDKRYWENKRMKIRSSEKQLEETLITYSEEMEKFQKEKKELLKKAKNEAQEILNSANKQIENTIRIIRETQADKEKTKEAREEITKLKNNITPDINPDEEKILRKIEKIKEVRQQKIKKIEEENPAPKKEIPEINITDYQPGDLIKIKNKEAIGEIIDSSGQNLVVAFGQMISTIKKDDAEKISKNEYKKHQQTKKQGSHLSILESMHKKRLEFKTSIDIRGMRGEAAIQLITNYIDEAIMLDISEVRILHGKGNGILRQLLRDYLRSVQLIKSISDAPIEFGGDGISVVKLGM